MILTGEALPCPAELIYLCYFLWHDCHSKHIPCTDMRLKQFHRDVVLTFRFGSTTMKLGESYTPLKIPSVSVHVNARSYDRCVDNLAVAISCCVLLRCTYLAYQLQCRRLRSCVSLDDEMEGYGCEVQVMSASRCGRVGSVDVGGTAVRI